MPKKSIEITKRRVPRRKACNAGRQTVTTPIVKKGRKTMKARTVILFIIAKLMVFAITASAAVMSYLPLACLAYEERGYFAIGGEVLGALIITAVVGWAANIVMKDWFRGMLKLFGKVK